MHLFSFILCLFFFWGGIIVPSASLAAATDWTESDEVSVRLLAGNYETIDKQKTLNLGLHFTLKDNWKLYWRTPGDGGLPSSLNWERAENLESPILQWPAPKRYVEFDAIENFAYKKEVVLPIKATIIDPNKPVKANLDLDYAVCEEICIFLNAKLDLDIPKTLNDTEANALIEKHTAFVPSNNGAQGLEITGWDIIQEGNNKGIINITASSEDTFKSPDVLVEGGENFRFTKPEITTSKGTANFKTPYEILLPDLSLAHTTLTLTFINGEKSVEATIQTGEAPPPPAIQLDSIAIVLLFAFIGGLILNVMPCVLPVLSIKLLSVIKHGGSHPHRVRAAFFSSAAGIIVSFLVLAGLVVGLKEAGNVIGWGFHFQSPTFLTALVVILTLFAANMWSLFEINLPQWLQPQSTQEDDTSLAGHFFSGALATILATPCSAPFVGTAISFALAQGILEITLIFGMLGVGLASPYLVFAFFPHLVSKLPKPGAWMVKIKHFMGYLLAATAIWLIWVLAAQLGIMASIVLAGLSILILLFLWNIQKHFIISGKPAHMVLVTVTVILSFIMPPQYASKAGEEIVFEELWVPFNEAKIEEYIGQGKVVFVDVTADWCLTCKANKLLVLSRDRVKEKLNQPNIIAMKADWTKPNDTITRFLKHHGRHGIPFNVVYGPAAPEGIKLSELLSKSAVLEAIEKAGGN